MNASKERAEQAVDIVKDIMIFAVKVAMDGLEDDCRKLLTFIVTAQKKLPHESSFPNPEKTPFKD
jgi:hypothetical protein